MNPGMGMVLSAMTWRPVWIRYGKFIAWHVIRGDVKIMSDLRKPVCGWRADGLAIDGVGLVPVANTPICTACLQDALGVKGWVIQ